MLTREFVEDTDFDGAYLGLVQVGDVDPSMRFDVVDIAQSEVNLSAVIAARDGSPSGGQIGITTLLLRVLLNGDKVPDRIAIELDIEEDYVTFSGG